MTTFEVKVKQLPDHFHMMGVIAYYSTKSLQYGKLFAAVTKTPFYYLCLWFPVISQAFCYVGREGEGGRSSGEMPHIVWSLFTTTTFQCSNVWVHLSVRVRVWWCMCLTQTPESSRASSGLNNNLVNHPLVSDRPGETSPRWVNTINLSGGVLRKGVKVRVCFETF